jgi:hypothetical protein
MRRGTSSGRASRVVSLPNLLLVFGICFLPGVALADTGAPSVGPTVGGDDNNYAKLTPYDAGAAANLMKARFITYCSWINREMNNFVATHPTYSFSWAAANDPVNTRLSGDLNVTTYNAWAATSPGVVGGDGVTRNFGIVNKEAGGANIVFTYTPKAGDPTNVRFIQAYNESLTGSAYQTYLDIPAGKATPFYDAYAYSGTAANGGRLANNVSWFQDRPYDTEPGLMPRVPTAEGANEIDTNSDVQFQVAMVVDNGPAAGGVTDALTLYGGLWWGYNYWNNDNIPVAVGDPATDPTNNDSDTYAVNTYDDPLSPEHTDLVPEPATGLVWAAVGIPLLARRRRDGK